MLLLCYSGLLLGIMQKVERKRREWKRVVTVVKEMKEECEMKVERVRKVVDAMVVEMHAEFVLKGRGTVATGRVEQGIIKVGDEVEVLGLMQAGDNVGLLLRGLKREDIQRGQVIDKPGSVKTSKKFEAEIYVLTKDEGGRHTAFFSNYKPQFYLRTADITGKVELPENVKMVMPRDNVTAVLFELISPVPLETGQRFALREGGRTVGSPETSLFILKIQIMLQSIEYLAVCVG
ncbi:hypothetical protein RIF29_40867 [Crotalaria pallida]|uniref:Translation elongation factor EFTu/EF1A C-terminal domain-containing protein n=1 Tax=Crotalaria pallida TaxID=3830 RepID=A0AAN9E9D3_CROPI